MKGLEVHWKNADFSLRMRVRISPNPFIFKTMFMRHSLFIFRKIYIFFYEQLHLKGENNEEFETRFR